MSAAGPAEGAQTVTFTEFERSGWQKAAGSYVTGFGDLTTQCIVRLLDAVDAAPGKRLLDVATGPGYVAGAATGRGVRAVGLDFSTAMLERASALFPQVEFRRGSAEDLPFEAESFDAVTINFGLFHFAHPDRALREAHRVLRRGGRIGFTAWARPQAVAFGMVLDAIAAHGNADVPLPAGPSFFQFSDAQGCAEALKIAAFSDPRFELVPQTWHVASASAMFEIFEQGTVRTAALLRAQSPAARERIRRTVEQAAMRYRVDTGAIEMPMPAFLASATKS